MPNRRPTRKSLLAVCANTGMMLGVLVAGDAAAAPTLEVTEPSSALAASSKKGSVKLSLSGQHQGKRAKVTLRGVKGPAKGTKRVAKIRKRATVAGLRPGVYKVKAKSIKSSGRTAVATVRPAKVKVRSGRRATVKIRYRVKSTPTPTPITPSPAPITPPQVPPPAPGPTLPPTTFITTASIATGALHSCGLDSNGAAWCWGNDPDGQLGDGPGPTSAFEPVQVSGGRTYTTISAGNQHSCALDSNGAAWCWGYDGTGQVGDGAGATTALVPVQVSGGRTYKILSAGDNHTCALELNGTAWCWGSDASGQVGDGAGSTDRFEPVQVSGGRSYTTLSAGNEQTCALESNGTAWCWGDDTQGQLGDGPGATSSFEPVRVSGSNYATVSAGGSHSCALDTDGAAWCWGRDFRGQLGDGEGDSSAFVPVRVSGSRSYTSLTTGEDHTCAVDTAAAAWCWGWDGSGQVGDGAGSTNRFEPVQVSGGRSYSNVVAGTFHTCAVDTSNGAWCWGSDAIGQLGDGPGATSRFEPIRVAGNITWKQPTPLQ